MPLLRDILIPLDGSRDAEKALAHARVVGRSFGARLHLVRVVPSSADETGEDPVAWRTKRTEAASYLRAAARPLAAGGLPVERSVVGGDPAERIVSLARRKGVDAVILTPTGSGGAGGGGSGMGGTAHRVVDRVGSSVLLAREEPGDGYETVLSPVDGSAPSEWSLRAGGALVRPAGGELLAPYVVEMSGRGEGEPADGSGGRARGRLERRRLEARAFLEEACGRLRRPGLRLEPRVVTAAHAARRLHELAGESGADLVVLSAHGRSGSAPWPYGSVATNLLLYGSRSTLVLQDQPEGRSARPAAREEPVRPSRTPPPAGERRDRDRAGPPVT